MRNSTEWSVLLTSSAKLARPTSTDNAFGKIRAALIKGELTPGQRLVESEIAERLGMSRTPIREALQRLEVQGYLTRLSRGRLIVANHSSTQTRNLFEIREALESMAIKLASERATEEQLNKVAKYHNASREVLPGQDEDTTPFIELNLAFHSELLSACGNEQLLSLTKIFGMDQFVYTRLTRVFTSRDWRTAFIQHERILKAVCERNPNRAAKATSEHIRTSMRIALKRL